MNLAGISPRQKEPRPARNPERLAKVKQLPCVVCGASPPSDAHHCIHDRFSQRKASDDETIPLCKACHQDGPEAIHNGKDSWRRKHGADYDYLKQVDEMLAEWF